MKRGIERSRPWRRTGTGVCAAVWLAGLVLGLAAAASPGAAVQGVVNVNTATVEQLEVLPGIGEARAQAIVRLRKERGGIENLGELTQVRGVGEALLQKLRPHLALDGKTTIQRL